MPSGSCPTGKHKAMDLYMSLCTPARETLSVWWQSNATPRRVSAILAPG